MSPAFQEQVGVTEQTTSEITMKIKGAVWFVTEPDCRTTGAAIAWALDRKINLVRIPPGNPTQNAYVESFNSKLREECLRIQNLFETRRMSCSLRASDIPGRTDHLNEPNFEARGRVDRQFLPFGRFRRRD